MAEVFVSYASADRDKAKQLADALAARGYSVWWDRTIPPGRVFDEVIQEALNAAQCVVVLWSKASVASNWVKTEAAEAANRNILVPALIENVAPPIEFKRIQAANLLGWDGKSNSPELENLLDSVDRLARGGAANQRHHGPGDVSGEPEFPRAASSGEGNRRRFSFAAMAASIGLVVLASASWFVYQRSSFGGKGYSAVPAVEESAAPGRAIQPVAERQATVSASAVPSANKMAGDAVPRKGRINLLALENGGQVVAASKDVWAKLIDGDENSGGWVDGGEGVYAFKDERPAVFEMFTVLINGTSDYNLNEFELLSGNESPTGQFESIGKFKTQNLKLFKTPYQEFRFAPVSAKYFKVRSLSNHRGERGGSTTTSEFQLFGRLD